MRIRTLRHHPHPSIPIQSNREPTPLPGGRGNGLEEPEDQASKSDDTTRGAAGERQGRPFFTHSPLTICRAESLQPIPRRNMGAAVRDS